MSPSVDLINIKSISPNGTGQIDVPGDLNLTGTSPNPVYRINGVPLATGGTPAGSNTQIQYNANGAFGASSVLSFDDASVRLNIGPQVSATITYGPSPIAFISYADTQAAIESQARIGLGVANNANATGNYASIGFYGVNSGATPTYHLAAMITAKTASRNASGINANLVFATRPGTADPLREVMRVSGGGSVAVPNGPVLIGTTAIPANTNLYIQGSTNALVSNGDVIINCDSGLGGGTNLRLGTRGPSSDKPEIAIPPEIAFMWVGKFRPLCIFTTADVTTDPREAIRAMPETAYVGIGGATNPAYPLDVAGDVNTTGQYRINGVPLAGQTPWTSNINGANYTLGNVSALGIGIQAEPTITPVFVYGNLPAGNALIYAVNGNPNGYATIQAANNVGTSLALGVTGSTSGASADTAYISATAPMMFLTGSPSSAERMRITATGNVGIGQANPQYLLDLAGANPIARINGTGGGDFAGVSLQTPNQEYRLLVNGLGSNEFIIHDSTAGVPRLMITSGGRVGMGVTFAAYDLDIGGLDIRIGANGASAAIRFGNTGAYIWFDGTGWQFSPPL